MLTKRINFSVSEKQRMWLDTTDLSENIIQIFLIVVLAFPIILSGHTKSVRRANVLTNP